MRAVRTGHSSFELSFPPPTSNIWDSEEERAQEEHAGSFHGSWSSKPGCGSPGSQRWSAYSNSDNSFPFTLDVQEAFSQNFPHQVLCPIESRKFFFSQQMRKVPPSTLEGKGYNQKGWRWGFDGLKPGTLRGSLENCSPDCPYIPSRTFSIWCSARASEQTPLVSMFPHCVSQHLTKAWQEATNVCSHESEENAQKTLLKGLLDPSWFPEEKEKRRNGSWPKAKWWLSRSNGTRRTSDITRLYTN